MSHKTSICATMRRQKIDVIEFIDRTRKTCSPRLSIIRKGSSKLMVTFWDQRCRLKINTCHWRWLRMMNKVVSRMQFKSAAPSVSENHSIWTCARTLYGRVWIRPSGRTHAVCLMRASLRHMLALSARLCLAALVGCIMRLMIADKRTIGEIHGLSSKMRIRKVETHTPIN